MYCIQYICLAVASCTRNTSLFYILYFIMVIYVIRREAGRSYNMKIYCKHIYSIYYNELFSFDFTLLTQVVFDRILHIAVYVCVCVCATTVRKPMSGTFSRGIRSIRYDKITFYRLRGPWVMCTFRRA